jgi:hypothetical protein
VNVFLNPGSQNFPRSGVKKSLYRVEHLDHPMFIAAPISHFWVVPFNPPHIRLLTAKFYRSVVVYQSEFSDRLGWGPTSKLKRGSSNGNSLCGGCASPLMLEAASADLVSPSVW